jgi:hypothetical protein
MAKTFWPNEARESKVIKKQKWDDLNREQKLANIMFPHLAPKPIQDEMRLLAANEGKKSPTVGRQEQASRSGKARRK